MTSIPTKHITGDVSVGRNVALGGNAIIRGSAEIGHNLKVKGWLEAENIKGVNKGLFKSEEQLNEAYPKPQAGWFALVGDSLPAQVYIAIGGVWVGQYNDDGSPKLSGELTIDSTIYLETVEKLIGELEGIKADIENNSKLITNGDGELLKRIQGRSKNSQSLYDPFKVLPESIDECGGFETIAGILRSLNTLVPGQHGEYADTLCGYYRGNLQGVPLQVYNFPLHYATEEVVQYLIGPFALDDNGNIVGSMIHYFILRRRHSANKGWEPWVQLKMLTVNEINDINDKISGLQKDINEIDKKIESSDTVVAALTKAEINDLCDCGECKAVTEEEMERALNEEFYIDDYKNCGCFPAALSEVLDVLGTERPDCECGGITEEEINDI